eukprot:c5306_g1_i2 orf=289-1071(-)
MPTMVGTAHPDPLEVVEATAEIVDFACTAIQRCLGHTRSGDGTLDKLEQERLENQHLKLTLEECQKTLAELQKAQKNATSTATESSESSPVQQSTDQPSDLCKQLKNKVNSPEFLEKVKEIQKVDCASSASTKSGEDVIVSLYPEDPNGWLWVPDDQVSSDPKVEPNGLDSDGYIVVSEEDVVEGMAVFVARCILVNPHAKNMTPKELQDVLSTSLAKLDKGTIWKLWDVVKVFCVAASWGITAFELFRQISCKCVSHMS